MKIDAIPAWMKWDYLVCPKCKGELTKGENYLLCGNCKESFPIRDGIVHFLEKERFWGEPGIDIYALENIIREMEGRNWHEVLSENSSESIRSQSFFIENLERAKWHEILGLSRDSIFLDLGAGMGTISQSLSKYYKWILAVEPVELRCEFMRARFRQEGIANISIIRGDTKNLPFRDEFFDHIVLNGVLEWIPYSYKDVNPRKAQLMVLIKLRKLLKEKGTLSIGIENRFCYAFLLGRPDCHMGVRYAGVLPRFCADIICRRKIGDIYRPYTYSWIGLRKLLKEAGFGEINIYSSLPSYNEPELTIELKSKSEKYMDYIWPTRRRSVKILKALLNKVDLLKYLGYAFRVVAKK